MVKDLWFDNQKAWNSQLVNTLFTPETAAAILQTPIVDSPVQDLLVWKLIPAGEFSTKSAYKHCYKNLELPINQRLKPVPQQVIALLNQVWAEKLMLPRVQTFAWRLLRRALATGKRAGKYSKHIKSECCRCGAEEDEMHMLFLCQFSKAVWFSHP